MKSGRKIWWLARKRPEVSPQGDLGPVALMHGFLGFRRLGPLQYFSGVKKALGRAGFAAYEPTVNPLQTTEYRAYQWFYGRPPAGGSVETAERVFRPGKGARSGPHLAEIYLKHRKPLNLISHSQGCIDARLLIAPEGLGDWKPFDHPDYEAELRALRIRDCVGALATVSAPHNGVRYAEEAVDELALLKTMVHPRFTRFMEFLSREDCDGAQSIAGFGPSFMTRFNRRYSDPEDVELYSVAGEVPAERVTFFLRSFYRCLSCDARFEQAPSDGLVCPASAAAPLRDGEPSASWTFLGTVAADHVEQIGLPFALPSDRSFKHLDFYVGLARRMSGEELVLQADGRWAQASSLSSRSRRSVSAS